MTVDRGKKSNVTEALHCILDFLCESKLNGFWII